MKILILQSLKMDANLSLDPACTDLFLSKDPAPLLVDVLTLLGICHAHVQVLEDVCRLPPGDGGGAPPGHLGERLCGPDLATST